MWGWQVLPLHVSPNPCHSLLKCLSVIVHMDLLLCGCECLVRAVSEHSVSSVRLHSIGKLFALVDDHLWMMADYKHCMMYDDVVSSQLLLDNHHQCAFHHFGIEIKLSHKGSTGILDAPAHYQYLHLSQILPLALGNAYTLRNEL